MRDIICGNIEYTVNDALHRIGMPAFISYDGEEGWYFDFYPHRINGESGKSYSIYNLYGENIYINIGKLVI